jgi:hypothetical protein
MKKKTTPKAKVKTVTNKSLDKGIGGGGLKKPRPKK